MSKPEFQGALTRDRSLITGRGSRGGGGLQNGRGEGQVKFYPYIRRRKRF